jgi:hypothetical protein
VVPFIGLQSEIGSRDLNSSRRHQHHGNQEKSSQEKKEKVVDLAEPSLRETLSRENSYDGVFIGTPFFIADSAFREAKESRGFLMGTPTPTTL